MSTWLLPTLLAAAAAAASPPCCTDPDPEGNRAAKCLRRLQGENGGCKPIHERFCPVACGYCNICASHPLRDKYLQLYSVQKAPAATAQAGASSLDNSSDNSSAAAVDTSVLRSHLAAKSTPPSNATRPPVCTVDPSVPSWSHYRGHRPGVEEWRARYRCRPDTANASSPGLAPLCARLGATWSMVWSRRVSMTKSIHEEGAAFATVIADAHARAHAAAQQLPLERRPGWMQEEQRERRQMDKARADLASLLTQTRRRHADPCVMSMPWFYVNNKNFGDELNVDLGAALLGDQTPFKRCVARMYTFACLCACVRSGAHALWRTCALALAATRRCPSRLRPVLQAPVSPRALLPTCILYALLPTYNSSPARADPHQASAHAQVSRRPPKHLLPARQARLRDARLDHR